MSINRVSITGHLTHDAELRATPSGTALLRFTVAVNDRHKNTRTGEWEDYPNFIGCVVFGDRAAGLSRILAKGMKVAVDGKLRFSSWQAQNGSRRSKIEVMVDNLDLMTTSRGQSMPQAPAGTVPQESPSPSVPELYDEDVPF